MNTQQLISLEHKIAKDRIKYHASPVKLHEIPRWFKTRLAIVLPTPAVFILDQVAGVTTQRIFDHWGMAPDDSVVGEPYAKIDDTKIEAKAKVIADALGIRVAITNTLTSWWYPGRTIRIAFFEADDSKSLTQLRADAKAAMKQGKTLFSCMD